MIAHPIHWRHARSAAACCAALAALTLVATGTSGAAAAPLGARAAPVVPTDDGPVRGMTAGGIDEFLGIPYAAPPIGNLRWRPPAPPAGWRGVRDATQFGPSCPQPAPGLFAPPGPFSEDCLYLNVYTPARTGNEMGNGDPTGRPVIVWIHGGGLTEEAGRNYDPAKLTADGTVVVTINYRLGALGFLAHPALASRPGGPAGNYGLMDQQAALRWVQDNISRRRTSPGRSSHRPWRRTSPSSSICSTCPTRSTPPRSTPDSRGSRPACKRPGRTSPPPATPPPRPCPGHLSPARTACGCCRSSRHNRNSRRTSPPGTIAPFGAGG
jgi:hypothetical protein